MVGSFALNSGHGGCSGHVSARSQSRFSCVGVYVWLPIGAVHGTEHIPKHTGRILLRATERHDTGALAVPRDDSILLALVIVRQSLCREVNRGWGWTARCRSLGRGGEPFLSHHICSVPICVSSRLLAPPPPPKLISSTGTHRLNLRPVVIVIHHAEPHHSKTATAQRLRSHL